MPLQFHHAYSVRFYRPKDSPLHDEVVDLWERQAQPQVIELLSPYMKKGDFSNHIEFHNAVMSWKCSLLTDEECQEHQDWIDQNLQEKEELLQRPWAAMREEGVDELLTENRYIQWYAIFITLDDIAIIKPV